MTDEQKAKSDTLAVWSAIALFVSFIIGDSELVVYSLGKLLLCLQEKNKGKYHEKACLMI